MGAKVQSTPSRDGKTKRVMLLGVLGIRNKGNVSRSAIYMGFKEPIRCFARQKISFYKSPGDLNCGRVGEAHPLKFFNQNSVQPEMGAPNSAYNSLSCSRYSMALWA